jgi:hypothetical protein
MQRAYQENSGAIRWFYILLLSVSELCQGGISVETGTGLDGLFQNPSVHVLEDWILAWMAVSDDGTYAPIPGITMIQKQMVVIIREFAPDHDIPSENPGFRAYRFGPYTERIDRALDTLYRSGYMYSEGRINSNSERFYLTESGVKKGLEIISRFDDGVKVDLLELKRDLQQFTLQGIETYVYSKYPEYTNESEIFERVLHRKRS